MDADYKERTGRAAEAHMRSLERQWRTSSRRDADQGSALNRATRRRLRATKLPRAERLAGKLTSIGTHTGWRGGA